MADNDISLTGQASSTKPGAGGGATKKEPVIGIVKDNIDPTRSGIIQVQLEGSTNPGSSSKNSGGWVKVRYLSTYFGSVKPTAGDSGAGSYKGNPSSYGQWQSPPDIGTKVVCIFINGDPTRGFYIGAVPEPEMMQMVPALGSSDKIVANEGEAAGYGGATRLPVTNINTNDSNTTNSPSFNEQPRPVHSYSASVMSQQGIIRDPIRGPISSSAAREPVSRVGWGVSTPGRPIYEGGYDDSNLPKNLDDKKQEQLTVVSRRGGHSIVMDDGDVIGRDQLIRIRTSLGHQILMSDDGQTLMILHSNGQSYVELGKEGTVDVFATNSINLRTQGDFNIHADQHVNIHAMENLNIQAKNIHVVSEEETKLRSGKDLKLFTLANLTAKATGALAMAAGGEGSLVAGAAAYVNGSKVNLNSGSPGLSPEEVPIITLIAQTDTLFDEAKGWAAAPGKLLTVATRTPSHAPWANAGQGVSVKTTGSADEALPQSPTTSVQQANRAGVATGAQPPATATVASAPAVNPASESMDAGTTSAVLGSVATSAATGPTATAVEQGAGIVPEPTASNPTAESGAGTSVSTVAIGSYGQTPSQLVQSGVLKPGSDSLVAGLASSGSDVQAALPDSIFAGAPGAENLTALVSSVEAQSASMTTTLQQAQTALTDSGVMSGRENALQIAGLVTAGATQGIDDTVAAVREISSLVPTTNLNPDTAITSAAGTVPVSSNQSRAVLDVIGAGAAAAGLSVNLSGLGGIASALGAMTGKGAGLSTLLDQVKGVAGAAFASITESFGSLEANKPQYLTAQAKELAAQTAALSSRVPTGNGSTNPGGQLSTLAQSNILQNNVASVAGNAETASAIMGNVNNTISAMTGAITNPSPAPNVTTASLINTVATSTISGNQLTNNTSNLTTLIDQAAGINTAELSNVNDAVNQISGLAGAGPAIMSGGIPELANAAKATQAGGAAALAAQLASGIKNLPGGQSAVASVTNNALGAANRIPGADRLTSLINNAQTIAQTAGDALNTVTSVLGDQAGALGGLASAVTSGLSIGDTAGLNSALSALSAGGPSPTKLPDIGFNTFSREGLTSQIESLIGDPGIPKPNLLGDSKENEQKELETLVNRTVLEFARLDNELSMAQSEALLARSEYQNALFNLDEGDPAIAAASSKLNSARQREEALQQKLDELSGMMEETNALASQIEIPSLPGTTGGFV